MINPKLERQCSEHGFILRYIDIPWNSQTRLYAPVEGIYYKRPEDAVMYILSQSGFKGTTYELHPVMMLMQSACAALLKSCSKNFLLEDWQDRTFSVQITQYQLEKRIVLDIIRNASFEYIMSNVRNILKSSNINKWFPTLVYDDIQVILEGLGKHRLELLASMLFSDPTRNGIGWPDIISFRDNDDLFIEVKTTDALLDSQIYTWKNLLPKLNINAEIICVRKI